MDMEKIKARILELVAQLTDQELTEDAFDQPLAELNVDSLMALELAVHLEREFGFRLTEEELASISKMEDILKAIQKNEAQS